MKKILLFALLLAVASTAFSQQLKKTPPPPANNLPPSERKINAPQRLVPPAQNGFGLPSLQFDPIAVFAPQQSDIQVTRGENGLPILFEGKTEASANVADVRAGALAYLASLKPMDILEPSAEFVAKRVETDELGNSHVRLEQVYKGVSVFGGEVIAHARRGAFDLLNGRYFPTPQLASVVPALNSDRAIDKVKQHIGLDKIKNWTAAELSLFKIEPFKTELVIYHHDEKLDNERLAWHVEAYPNPLSRVIYFIDANTGEVIHHYDFTCKMHFGLHDSDCGLTHPTEENPQSAIHNPQSAIHNPQSEMAPPPVIGTGTDLLGFNRSFGAWQQGSTYYMEDASKPMYNAAASTMPGDPVGVIVTLNAGNTSPENQNFDYNFVTSGSTTFNNPNAVSTHWNSIRSYDYFLNMHGRNSIDGAGGNILAFFNVSEGNGSSMENAYWNGAAMWYGNGGSTFKQLARGLDVGGHEMTHGVVEKTANLTYQNESGALNESFADIFGAMIDRDDWLIGEDVMQPGASPGGALRSMQDPHNNAPQGSSWWQPRTVSEQYTGSQDNGGVHINSGIPNWAYYKFATATSKEIAEKVYYKALKDYLVKSSKFVDLRIAVLQAATELYGNSTATAAANAFDQVGILGSSPGGNYLGQLQANPGTQFVLCVTNSNPESIEIRNASGQTIPNGTIYTQGVKSRPSISDNGADVVFVNDAGHIIYINLSYSPFQASQPQQLSNAPEWRNVVLSKDGSFIAGVVNTIENVVYVFDLENGEQEAYELYNPTYSTGQVTGEVQYADVLEFDYSGEYLMYDAFNELSSSSSGDISYWDIGFLKFWENNGLADPNNHFISKLFSGLPEKASIGNPTFSKNSPYIIAFDFIDGINDKYSILGANVETGDNNFIVDDNFGSTGWPNYNRQDNVLLYEGKDNGGNLNIYTRPVAADKISSGGNETQFIANRQWGVWFANGNRSLSVNTDAPANAPFSVAVMPNPVSDLARLNVVSKAGTPVQVSLLNLLGETLQTREYQLAEGENLLDLNVQNLPSGTYVVRLFTGNNGVAVKVVKQ
jgi:Zn-dependent metalloprotease